MKNLDMEIIKLANKIALSWEQDNCSPAYVRAYHGKYSDKLSDLLFDKALEYCQNNDKRQKE